jgi:hypothetical protein
MSFESESKDACHRVSLAAKNVRDAMRQKAGNEEIRSQFVALAQDVATLVEALRRNQTEMWSLLQGQYSCLFSSVIDSLDEAARRKLTDSPGVRHACDQINEGLCAIQYLKHSRSYALAATSSR